MNSYWNDELRLNELKLNELQLNGLELNELILKWWIEVKWIKMEWINIKKKRIKLKWIAMKWIEIEWMKIEWMKIEIINQRKNNEESTATTPSPPAPDRYWLNLLLTNKDKNGRNWMKIPGELMACCDNQLSVVATRTLMDTGSNRFASFLSSIQRPHVSSNAHRWRLHCPKNFINFHQFQLISSSYCDISLPPLHISPQLFQLNYFFENFNHFR